MANQVTPGAPGRYTGGRKTGFSLRESLTAQGVTSETSMREHLSLVHGSLMGNPRIDISRYRVDPNYPNGPIRMG